MARAACRRGREGATLHLERNRANGLQGSTTGRLAARALRAPALCAQRPARQRSDQTRPCVSSGFKNKSVIRLSFY